MTEGPAATSVDGSTGPRIVVVGLGGAGGNAVDNMIRAKLDGVDFLIANTDAQALEQSQCERRVQLGRAVTRGLGAGSRPEIGRAATEEALDEVLDAIEGTHMVFITAGMGGGTGTGGAPVIAQATRAAGILTVGVVTKPFHFEGIRRMRLAEAGIIELAKQVDTLIVIPNQNLFRVADEKTTFADAFRIADEVLHSGVRGVTDLMVMPGLINLDFADIQSVMAEMGKAIMGTGEAEGAGRALEAAEAAISNPLLDDVSMKGARGVLINISGGMDMTLFEVDQAANRIREEVDNEANIIFGSVFDQRLEGRMRVSVVATGIEAEVEGAQPRSVPLSLIVSRGRDQAVVEEAAAAAVAPEPEPAGPEPAEPEPKPKPEAAPFPSAGSTADKTDGGAAAASNGVITRETGRETGREAGMEPAAQGGGTAFKAIRDDVAEWSAPTETAPAEDDTVVEIATPAMPQAKSKPLFGRTPKPASTSAAQSDSTQSESAQSDSAQPDSAQPDSAQSGSAQSGSAQSGSAQSESTQSESTQSTAAPAEAVPSPKLTSASGPGTGSAAGSEPELKKRRSGGLFAWMASRSSAGSEENFEKGDRHYYGQGVRKNLALALRAYRKAADQGHAAAQNRLGWMYEKGEGTEADYAEAVTWYHRAAEQGHINAMNDLGYMHRQGWGVPQSYSEALRWFRKAAEKYDSYAEYNMGQMYENGWGVEKDLDEAIRWFRRSAARGHEWAAKRLEEMGVRT